MLCLSYTSIRLLSRKHSLCCSGTSPNTLKVHPISCCRQEPGTICSYLSRKCLGGPDRKALAHKSEATRKGAAEKHLLCPFKAGGRRYKVAGRQNYTQRIEEQGVGECGQKETWGEVLARQQGWGEMGSRKQMLLSTEAESCIKGENKRNKEGEQPKSTLQKPS